MSKLVGKLKQKARMKAFQAAGKTHGKGESFKLTYGNVRNQSGTRQKYYHSTKTRSGREIDLRSNNMQKGFGVGTELLSSPVVV